jgi:hypothetical protein
MAPPCSRIRGKRYVEMRTNNSLIKRLIAVLLWGVGLAIIWFFQHLAVEDLRGGPPDDMYHFRTSVHILLVVALTLVTIASLYRPSLVWPDK